MRQSVKLLTPMLAVSVLLAACGSSSSTSTSSTQASQTAASQSEGASVAVVKTATSSSLGKAVLVDAQGMTLYALSGEQNGKFICSTSACEGVWHPLTVSPGTTPSGSVSLGTVKRPNGSVQVTYNGMPLYTFAQDHAAGEANGQGVKDVGTWSAVTPSSSGSAGGAAPSPSTPSTTSGGESGGYNY